MAAAVIGEVLRRVPSLKPADVDDVMLGCAMPEAEQGLNVARIASLRAGVPVDASAVTMNRFCASGLQAIASAAEHVMCGFADIVIAGGTESMSLVPMGGNKVCPNPTLVEEYPDVYLSTGLVAENHAREYGISREEQDQFAFRSHQRALAAIDAGRFTDEITPLTFEIAAAGSNGAPVSRTVTFAQDEGPRRDTSESALAKLRPAFHATGTVTAGNSSQTSDGAAAVIVTSAEAARDRGLEPLARLVSFATAGVEPERFGIGPVPAVRKALARAGLTLDQIDLDRVERGIRVTGSGLLARAADRSRAPQRQRRRDRARPPTWLHWRQADDLTSLRDAPAKRALRPGHDVCRGRNGCRWHLRTAITKGRDYECIMIVITPGVILEGQ